MDRFVAHIDANRARYRAELDELLRTPSIAAQGVGIEETAAWVARRLERIGAAVQVLRLPGAAPLVYGSIGGGARTLLIYDHYDVQPPEPLELWDTPAFEPHERNGHLYARGVADNKGNLLLRIQAIESWLATEGELPLRVNFLIEGEEEIGSVNLEHYCETYADLFRADGCLWETGGKNAHEQPTIQCGAKGICYVELVARGASYDLHSANAPSVPNPAWRLVWALNTIKGPDERILIPGFYDGIRPPTASELAAADALPDDDAASLADWGIKAFLGGVRGAERRRRNLFDPTATICGFGSGYTGAGSKTVLPSEARVKIDFRMVPDQDPAAIVRQLRAHLDANGFGDLEILEYGHERAARFAPDARVVQAMAAAIRGTYGQDPIISPSMLGTGPVYPVCAALGTPLTTGCGTGYPGTRAHAPNENIRLADYWDAMRCTGAFLRAFAE